MPVQLEHTVVPPLPDYKTCRIRITGSLSESHLQDLKAKEWAINSEGPSLSQHNPNQNHQRYLPTTWAAERNWARKEKRIPTLGR